MRSRIVAFIVGAAILTGTYAVVGGGGGGGNAWAGTFDCYDAATCPAPELPSAVSCTTTIAPTSLQSTLASASGGDVICLNSSTNTGSVLVSNKQYSSDVVVRPASGVTAHVGAVDLDSGVSHLHFTGNGGGGSNMTIDNMNVNTGQSNTATYTNLTWDYLSFGQGNSTTGCFTIYGNSNFSNILMDHTRHDTIDSPGAGCGDDGRVLTRQTASNPPAGWFTMSNSHIGGGDIGSCSDGTQLEARNETIGPGNEFDSVIQGGCGVHVDAIQMFGDPSGVLIYDNYFHGNSDGIVNNDNPAVYTVRNNVFVGPSNPLIAATGGNGIQVLHNTVIWASGGTTIGVDKVNDGSNTPATNAIVKGNITDQDNTDQCAACTATWTYNLATGRAGTGNISGTPVYVSSPSSGYYHYQLDSSSPGYHAVDDGTSMGIDPAG